MSTSDNTNHGQGADDACPNKEGSKGDDTPQGTGDPPNNDDPQNPDDACTNEGSQGDRTPRGTGDSPSNDGPQNLDDELRDRLDLIANYTYSKNENENQDSSDKRKGYKPAFYERVEPDEDSDGDEE